MRILIINEKYKRAGTEVQTHREALLLRRYGHESLVLTFDPDFSDGWLEDGFYNISKRADGLGMLFFHTVFPDRGILKRIKLQIEEFKPDFIHINHASRHATAIYKSVRGYPCLQTLRDYGYVCPNFISIFPDFGVCDGYKSLKMCLHCCFKKNPNKIKFIMLLIRFWLLDRMRHKENIRFACPSQMLTEYCNRIGLDTKCINNPFEFSILDRLHLKRCTDFTMKTYLYFGEIVQHKGISQLISAFKDFAKDKSDVQLQLAGRIIPEYEAEFQRQLQGEPNKIQYLGELPYDQMMEVLMRTHTVVVPSLWLENYPNTALEATACGCLVLASERGGMREIIRDERMIFHVLNPADIIAKLEFAYAMDPETYREVTTRAKAWIKENNSIQRYYEQFMQRLQEC